MFSDRVLAHWIPGGLAGAADHRVAISVDPLLSANRSVSVLHVDDGSTVLSLTPRWAEELAVTDGDRVDEAVLAERIDGSTVSLNDPDHLFYWSLRDQAALQDDGRNPAARQLTAADAPAFARFTSRAPEVELDEAFVELDHWLVFGTFVRDELVCAASTYPWSESQLADLGVITLPGFRGRGLGRQTVRAISAAVLRRGYEPQYRCRLDNTASVALAHAAGLTHFGRWEVIDPEQVDPARQR